MKKRFLLIMLSAILLLTSIPLAASAVNITDFTDVKPSAWYYEAVEYAVENGLYSGTSKTTFSPHAPMTRGMFVTVLGRNARASDSYKSTQTPFSDIKESDYYYAFASWARDNGVVSGVGNNQFAPNQSITREQMATMFFNYAKRFSYNMAFSETKYQSFPDTNRVSAYAVDALKWATYNKIINGTDTRLAPKGIATRAQVAQMFFNFSKVTSPSPTPSPSPEPTPEPTPDPNDWQNYNPVYERPIGKSAVDSQGGYYDYDLANEVMDMIDALRVENGAEPLKFHPVIQEWAGIRAKEFEYIWTTAVGEVTSQMAHKRPDGTSYGTVGYFLSGENLITSSSNHDAQYFVDAWFNSDGHKMNMLKQTAKLGSVSCYIKDKKVYAAHLFSEKTIYIFDSAI